MSILFGIEMIHPFRRKIQLTKVKSASFFCKFRKTQLHFVHCCTICNLLDYVLRSLKSQNIQKMELLLNKLIGQHTLISQAEKQINGFFELSQNFRKQLSILGRPESTFKNYIRHLAQMALHFKCQPTELDEDQINGYSENGQKLPKVQFKTSRPPSVSSLGLRPRPNLGYWQKVIWSFSKSEVLHSITFH